MTELDADTLLRTLLAHEVDFIGIGGLAVVAHGYVDLARLRRARGEE